MKLSRLRDGIAQLPLNLTAKPIGVLQSPKPGTGLGQLLASQRFAIGA
jgi:hypothetical protein